MSDGKANLQSEISNHKCLLWALAFTALSVLVTGYRVYSHNQALQIPLVRLLNDPSLYPNDPFAATLPHYASGVWRLVAWCARMVPLEPVLLVFFAIERFIVVYAAGSLALAFASSGSLRSAARSAAFPEGDTEPKRGITAHSTAAMLLTMAFIASDPTPIIGGGTILMPYFEQTSLAVGFLMLAMGAFYRRRPVAWAIWLAAAFNCNSLYGCYALTYFLAAFLIDTEWRREWRRWLAPSLAFAILSIPALLLSLAAYGSSTLSLSKGLSPVFRDLSGALRNGNPETNLPALWVAECRSRVPHHIFPSTWPWIKFARFTILILVVGEALSLARNVRLRTQALVWTVVSVAWVSFAFAAEALRSPSMMMLQPARATDLWYAFAGIAIMAACATALSAPPAKWRLSEAFVAFLALVPFVIFHPSGFATASMRGGLFMTPPKSVQQVCKWARTDTSKDAAFLVNPNMGDFRALAARPAFVTWKDGSALLWDRGFAVPWAERMQALGYDVTKGKLPGNTIGRRLDRLYESMSDADALRLAARYKLSYWLTSVKHASSLPVAYSNRYYKVLKLR